MRGGGRATCSLQNPGSGAGEGSFSTILINVGGRVSGGFRRWKKS